MERYIQISQLNDFIFCPKSIYLHNLYGKYKQSLYHQIPQQRGRLAHQTVDNQEYSSRKNVLQGLEIYSEKLKLCGKLDTFDCTSGVLVERKYKIKEIYEGYLYQVYAQYFCLIEMGFKVKKIFFHSLSDNKRYAVGIPTNEQELNFKKYVEFIRSYLLPKNFTQNPAKCKQCIYSNLCESYNP